MLFATSGLATGYCIERWACFNIEHTNSGVNVFLENKKGYVITATLAIQVDNLSVPNQQSSLEATRVLQAYEKAQVFALKPVNPTLDFAATLEQFNWTPGSRDAQHNDSYRYRLPFATGQRFPVVQGYGGGWSHRGASRYALDFDMPEGTPVHAARAGTVIDLSERHWRGGASRRYAKYANFVTVLHDDLTTGEYYHLRQQGVVVEVGEKVQAGTLLGYSGNTGFSSLPHLHFAVYKAQSHGGYQSIPIKFIDP